MASTSDSLVGLSSDNEAQNLKLASRQMRWTIAICSHLTIPGPIRLCFEFLNTERPAVVTEDNDPLTKNNQMEGPE